MSEIVYDAATKKITKRPVILPAEIRAVRVKDLLDVYICLPNKGGQTVQATATQDGETVTADVALAPDGRGSFFLDALPGLVVIACEGLTLETEA